MAACCLLAVCVACGKQIGQVCRILSAGLVCLTSTVTDFYQ